MAYQEYAIASLDDIPATVAAFATDLGWNVTFAGGKPVLKHPDYLGDGLPGGPGFQLGVERPPSTGTGSQNGIGYADKFVDLVWRFTTGETTDGAVMRSPLYGDIDNRPAPKVMTPTKLFLIGLMTPAPYIAIVVQFGYNSYRHLYMGFLEKQGVYENGAVISAHNGDIVNTNQDRYWLWNGYQQFLFSGYNTWGSAGQNGGVYIDSPTLTQKWRRFRVNNTMPSNPALFYQNLNGSEVFGGMRDGQSHAMVTKGKNAYAGAQVLVPINLFVTRMLADEFRLKPVGRPPGVRMLNIAELEPEAQVEVGGEQWYSFAANSKQNDNNNRRFWQSDAIRSDFVKQETSYNLGYAYRG